MRTELIIAFFAGICSQQWAPALTPLSFAIAPIPLAAIWGLFARKQWVSCHLSKAATGLTVCFLAGIVWGAFRADIALSHRLDSRLEGQAIALVGTVVSIPQWQQHSVSFEFDIDRIEQPIPFKNLKQPRRVRLSWHKNAQGQLPNPHVGEQWALTAKLKRPHRPQNPQGFDGEIRSLRTGIDAFGSVVSKKPALLRKNFVISVPTIINACRERIDRRIRTDPHLAKTAPLVAALSIGDQRDIDSDFWESLKATGTAHLISISGLHVGAIALLVAGVTNWLWRRNPKRLLRLPTQKVAAITAAVAALAFSAIAGWGIPVQRSAIMVITSAGLLYSRRSLSGLSILAQALLAVLLFDPWSPLLPGFWLSFGTVFLMILINQRVRAVSSAIDDASEKKLSARLPRWLRRWWKEALIVQLTVSVAVIPMTWWFFQQISIISIFANLIAIPLVTFIIVPVTLLTAFANFSLLSKLTNGLLLGFVAIIDWFASWPFATFTFAKPPLWTVLLAMIGFIVWLIHRRPTRWLGMFGFLPLVFWQPPRPPIGTAQITVFDVGQGNAAIVQTANHRLIVDSGPNYAGFSPPAEQTIVPYLRAKGIERLDGIVVTHRDSDHAGGLHSLLETVPAGWVMSPEKIAISPPVRSIRCRATMRWVWDGVLFELLYPTDADFNRFERSNDRSCLLKVSTDKQGILFPGDLDARPLRLLSMSTVRDKLASDILIAPHHGSRMSSPIEFIEAVHPCHVIFSVGYRNRFHHPHDDVVEHYEKIGAKSWRTDQSGAIVIALGKSENSVSAWRQTNRRYWWH